MSLTIVIQTVDVTEVGSVLSSQNHLAIRRRYAGVVPMVLRVRHTGHSAYIVLTELLVEVGKVLPLIVETCIGIGRDRIGLALGHRGQEIRLRIVVTVTLCNAIAQTRGNGQEIKRHQIGCE